MVFPDDEIPFEVDERTTVRALPPAGEYLVREVGYHDVNDRRVVRLTLEGEEGDVHTVDYRVSVRHDRETGEPKLNPASGAGILAKALKELGLKGFREAEGQAFHFEAREFRLRDGSPYQVFVPTARVEFKEPSPYRPEALALIKAKVKGGATLSDLLSWAVENEVVNKDSTLLSHLANGTVFSNVPWLKLAGDGKTLLVVED